MNKTDTEQKRTENQGQFQDKENLSPNSKTQSISDSIRELQGQIKSNISTQEEKPAKTEVIESPAFDAAQYVPISSLSSDNTADQHDDEINRLLKENQLAYEDSYVLESMIDGKNSYMDAEPTESTAESVPLDKPEVKGITMDDEYQIPKQPDEKPSFFQMLKEKSKSASASVSNTINQVKDKRDHSKEWYEKTFVKKDQPAAVTSESEALKSSGSHDPFSNIQKFIYNALHKKNKTTSNGLHDEHDNDSEEIIKAVDKSEYEHTVQMVDDKTVSLPPSTEENSANPETLKIQEKEMIHYDKNEELKGEETTVLVAQTPIGEQALKDQQVSVPNAPPPKKSLLSFQSVASVYHHMKDNNQLIYVYEGLGGLVLLSLLTVGIKKTGWTKTYQTVSALASKHQKLPFSLRGYVYCCQQGVIPFVHMPYLKSLFTRTRPDIYTSTFVNKENNYHLNVKPAQIKMSAKGQDVINQYISHSYGTGKLKVLSMNETENLLLGIVKIHTSDSVYRKFIVRYNLNKILLQSGYATVDENELETFPYQRQYKRWERYAKNHQLGIWSEIPLEDEKNVFLRLYYRFMRFWNRSRAKKINDHPADADPKA